MCAVDQHRLSFQNNGHCSFHILEEQGSLSGLFFSDIVSIVQNQIVSSIQHST